MADSNNNFKSTVEALFKGMDAVVSSKTVVGDAIHINDTIILPLVDVSFGIGAGSSSADKKEKGIEINEIGTGKRNERFGGKESILSDKCGTRL